MALTKSGSARSVVSSQSCSAGGTVTSSWQTINYGVSGVATITNGASGPSAENTVRMDFSADGSTPVIGPVIGGGGTTNSAVTRVPYTLAPGGQYGDWPYYRLVFTDNTGQSVTVQADDSTTTAIV